MQKVEEMVTTHPQFIPIRLSKQGSCFSVEKGPHKYKWSKTVGFFVFDCEMCYP